MTSMHYQQQMGRMIEVFGKNAYPRERIELIWKELKDFSDPWFTKIIDSFIGNLRLPPLVSEFCLEAAKERERQSDIRKREHKQDAKDFWRGTYQLEEVRDICQKIIQRMEGKTSDEDYQKFKGLLEETAQQTSPRECAKCSDTGLVFLTDEENGIWPYRCYCKNGERHPTTFARLRSRND